MEGDILGKFLTINHYITFSPAPLSQSNQSKTTIWWVTTYNIVVCIQQEKASTTPLPRKLLLEGNKNPFNETQQNRFALFMTDNFYIKCTLF